MSKQSEAVKRWRKNTKERIINAMGGCCQICGYDRCHSALALHHIDPTKKELSFASIRANPKKWGTVVNELQNAVLLCHNCHSEIHDGMTDLPEDYAKFDESFRDYKEVRPTHPCPVCGIDTPNTNKYCSLSCAGKSSRKVDWENYDLLEELKTRTKSDIAEELGITETAVRKREKKLINL